MRVVWKGEQKGKKGERERKERDRGRKGLCLAGAAGRVLSWLSSLWPWRTTRITAPVPVSEPFQITCPNLEVHGIYAGVGECAFDLGLWNRVCSGRQETEPRTRREAELPVLWRLPMSARCPVFPGSTTLSSFEEVPYLRGERGESHMWKTVSSPSVFSTSCSSIWGFFSPYGCSSWSTCGFERINAFNSTPPWACCLSPSHTAILYVQFN